MHFKELFFLLLVAVGLVKKNCIPPSQQDPDSGIPASPGGRVHTDRWTQGRCGLTKGVLLATSRTGLEGQGETSTLTGPESLSRSHFLNRPQCLQL